MENPVEFDVTSVSVVHVKGGGVFQDNRSSSCDESASQGRYESGADDLTRSETWRNFVQDLVCCATATGKGNERK